MKMGGRLGVQILERQDAITALHDGRRDLAGGDLAKDTASGHGPPSARARAQGQLASERLAQLLPELLSGVPFRRRLALDLGELLEQGALLRGQLDRRPDMHPHVHVAATSFADPGEPLAAQAVGRAVLRPLLDLEGRVAVGRRDLDRGAERRLSERDRQVVHQVVAVALEPRVLGDVEHGDQIAGRPIARPGSSVPPHREVVMVRDAGGDVYLELLFRPDASVALAFGARLLGHRALPRAARARRHGYELSEQRARGAPHFARAATGHAARGLGAWRRPGAATRSTALQGTYFHLLGGAARDLGQSELQRDLHVLAAVALPSGTLGAAEKRVEPAQPAEVPHEDVERFRQVEVGEPPSAPARAALQPRFAEPVVGGAPLGVAEYLVGLGDLLELRFGSFLLPRGDAVGMMLHRELAIGLLDLAVVRVALDPQDGVVVAFHSSSSPTRRLV